jgi:hypothetical protein
MSLLTSEPLNGEPLNPQVKAYASIECTKALNQG